jgi:hypothetical protein
VWLFIPEMDSLLLSRLEGEKEGEGGGGITTADNQNERDIQIL